MLAHPCAAGTYRNTPWWTESGKGTLPTSNHQIIDCKEDTLYVFVTFVVFHTNFHVISGGILRVKFIENKAIVSMTNIFSYV